MMKHTFYIFIASILFSISCNAQFKKGSKEKIRAYKIAYLTEALDLTAQEAEKFWPLYNTFDKKIMELRRKERFETKKNIRKKGGIENLSEADAQKIIMSMTEIAQNRHTLRANFHKKILNVISYKKLLKLEISEHEFNRKLLKKFRHGKRNQK